MTVFTEDALPSRDIGDSSTVKVQDWRDLRAQAIGREGAGHGGRSQRYFNLGFELPVAEEKFNKFNKFIMLGNF